jgi:hypothetical protein
MIRINRELKSIQGSVVFIVPAHDTITGSPQHSCGANPNSSEREVLDDEALDLAVINPA